MNSQSNRLHQLAVLYALALMLPGCASFDTSSFSQLMQPDGSVKAKLAFARLCERHGETEQARIVYEGVLKQDPTNRIAAHRLGVVAAAEGNLTKAETLLTKAAESGPPDAELFNDIGYTYYLQERLDEAEKSLRQAIESSPNYLEAWTNLGLVLGQQQKFDESLAAFRKSGTEAQAHCNLGYVMAQQNLLKSAQKEFREALSLDPELRPAVEGLLQVSSHIPGQEPVSVVSTTARRKQPNDTVVFAPSEGASKTPSAENASPPAAVATPGQVPQLGIAAPFSWSNDPPAVVTDAAQR